MGDVIAALMMGVRQLGDPVVLRLAAKSIAITLLIFAGLGAMLWWAFDAALGALMSDYLSDQSSGVIAGILAIVIGVMAAWLLFRVVALAVLQFFADEIVVAVEWRYYPDAAQSAKLLPFSQDLSNSLRGMGRAIGFNLLALPIALVLLFTAIGPAIVFLLVNAVLLGRELTDMAWLRHCAGDQSACPVGGGKRAMLGAVIAAMMAVPFINLVAPVVGAAAGTHLTQRALRQSKDRLAPDA